MPVDEAVRLLGVSRSHAYDLVARGLLPAIRLGRRLRIPRAAVEGLVDVAMPTSAADDLGVDGAAITPLRWAAACCRSSAVDPPLGARLTYRSASTLSSGWAL